MKKTLLCLGMAATLIFTQCSPPKLSGLAKKESLEGKAKLDFNDSKINESGRGFAVNMKYLPALPKKIALVSFYVDDPGITKVTGNNQSGKTYYTTNTGSAGAKAYANEFLTNGGLESIKTTFKKYDMEILTPNEFLTDDTKKQFYNNFVVQNSKGNELGKKIGAFFKAGANAGTTIETDEAADGYQLFKVNQREWLDSEHKNKAGVQNLAGSLNNMMIESMGYDLCKNLGVDAVLVVYNTQSCDKKWSRDRHWVNAVSMYMFAPNPLPLKEGKKDNMFYSKGLFYTGARIAFSKPLVIDPKIKDEAEKAQNVKDNYVAYSKIVAGLADRTGKNLTKEFSKKK
ncbi:MAG: hypothetical protein V4608_03155 [Bacteroidota bacterium]